MPSCPFCSENQYSPSYLPSTHFNGKRFDYLRCARCHLIYIDPLPLPEDYVKMYPPSYQSGVNGEVLEDPTKKLIGLRFSYQYQFDLIRKHHPNGRLLDYGCGNANFLINAKAQGIPCDGAEFSADHVAILKNTIEGSNFYTIEEFLNGDGPRYDIIRLSNVLEHLDRPIAIMQQLMAKLNPGGMVLLEGPIETNANLALLFRKAYFGLRKKLQPGWVVSHTPTHIFFTNAKNQLRFFEQLGLEQKHYSISEAEWPFPHRFAGQGWGGKLKVTIARISMLLSKLQPKWGNTFIYLGGKR